MANKKWYENGVRFQCQGSGKCCISRGEYGFVYLTDQDRQDMADELGLSISDFTRMYCDRSDGFFHLKEEEARQDCLFLKNKKCSIYKARPTQCRTWPFWPENMNAKNWKQDVLSFCPGVGKGPTISLEEINENMTAQRRADEELGIE